MDVRKNGLLAFGHEAVRQDVARPVHDHKKNNLRFLCIIT